MDVSADAHAAPSEPASEFPLLHENGVAAKFAYFAYD